MAVMTWTDYLFPVAQRRREWKQELHDRPAVQAATIDPGPVGLAIALTTGPGRNWASLWKPLIDAFGPVLGEDPARPFRPHEFRLMLQNMAAVAANYRRAGIRLFVLAYFVRSPSEVDAVREALGLPLRVVRLEVPLHDIERRLGGDVTSGRRDDLRAAAASIAAAEGAGVENMVIGNDRPVGVVARDVLTFLGWLQAS